MSVIMFFLVAGILGCILAMIAVAVHSNEADDLPQMEPISLLSHKETSMYEDLSTIAMKLGLRVFAKVPLSLLLQAEKENKRYKLSKQLGREIIPLVLTEIRTTKLSIVILPADFKSAFAINALETAKIPYIQLNNYNLPGLEKAIRDKLSGGKPRRGRRSEPQPPLPTPMPEEEAAEQQS